ncbi:predicted protein [Sclerotinia sclerotiorum 1980 UF-70]|uniref:Uncharacterized protein n=1 Tax=Sclerotinia sclerotiorum (strain ATCC 18683 / 1980 / Ss-1) TaxID=665079 RepID=A7EKA3_SCLS1|nr:predicted protein [Sclerotinia sclerotiorum 1980 UF-70]EDO03269.1 predicted protein [Sclerotinia sclerotiorum 1980 UF-70]
MIDKRCADGTSTCDNGNSKAQTYHATGKWQSLLTVEMGIKIRTPMGKYLK